MGEIFIGLAANGEREVLELSRANRHGLIAGATGTGKTVTLQGLAESFSAAGVPVFLADVKGDLSGVAMAGSPTFAHADSLIERAKALGKPRKACSTPSSAMPTSTPCCCSTSRTCRRCSPIRPSMRKS